MAERWLQEKTPIFSGMNPKAFENLIQRNIREVLIVPPKNSTSPSTLKLFECGVMSKRFVLILEGKASIRFSKVAENQGTVLYCGWFQRDLVFEVGPWTSFGEAILEKVEQCIIENRGDTLFELSLSLFFVFQNHPLDSSSFQITI